MDTTDRPIFPSSAKALAMSYPDNPQRVGRIKYPWRTMKVGESFHVAPNEANYNTISKSCYKWSQKLKKKFRAINHGETGIEVARLEMPLSVGNVVQLAAEAVVIEKPADTTGVKTSFFDGDK